MHFTYEMNKFSFSNYDIFCALLSYFHRMILSFLSLLCLRLTGGIGESKYLRKLNGTALDAFYRGTKPGVIVFPEEDYYPYDFMNYAISKYRGKIEFVVASAEDAIRYNITNCPEFIGFNNEIGALIASPHQNPFSFAEWCQKLVPKRIVRVDSPMYLRHILEGHQSYLLGVNVNDPPKNLRKKDTFYLINSSLFDYFQLNVSDGIYVYRYIDRQLLPADENYTSLLDTNLTDLYLLNNFQRKFFAGYKNSFDKTEENILELGIMSELANRFTKNFYIGPVIGDLGEAYVSYSRLSNLPAPFFFVTNANYIDDNKRWVIIDSEHVHDLEYISEFLKRIENGEEPQTVISEPINESDALQITANTFNDKISEEGIDKIIYIYNYDVADKDHQNLVVKHAARILSESPIKIYIYNCDKNDIPDIFVDGIELPLTMYYKQHTEDPIFFDGRYELDDFLQWVNSLSDFPLPEYDSAAANSALEAEFRSAHPPFTIRMDEL